MFLHFLIPQNSQIFEVEENIVFWTFENPSKFSEFWGIENLWFSNATIFDAHKTESFVAAKNKASEKLKIFRGVKIEDFDSFLHVPNTCVREPQNFEKKFWGLKYEY